MAVQQNKKSPSKRGMHRAHDFLTGPALAVEPTTGETPPAPPREPQRFLPWQEGRQGQGRVILLPESRRAASGALRRRRLFSGSRNL